MLLGGVLDAVHVQVAVEPRLVDGFGGTQAERDRGELPEAVELARVRVGGQAVSGGGIARYFFCPCLMKGNDYG